MELSDVARYFDQDPVLDGYTGLPLFSCQLNSFDDSAADGSTNRRRVMSLAPEITLPARRCLSIYGEIWLAGDPTTDGFLETPMRRNYALRRSTGIMDILTPGEAASNAVSAVSAHTHKLWFRDMVQPNIESDIDTFWNISVAPIEPVSQGKFFRDSTGTFFRVRQTYLPIQGLTIAQSDELDAGALKNLTITQLGTTYDPLTDSYPQIALNGTGLLLDINQMLRRTTPSDPVPAPGDRTLLIAKSFATPTVNAKLAFDSETWTVINVQSEQDAWLLRVRR